MEFMVRLPPGDRKRDIVDDITIIVADLSSFVSK